MAELTEQQIERIAEKAVETYMIRMGIELEDPRDMQSDLIFIRKFRQTCEAVGSRVVMVVVGVFTMGIIGGIWLAIKDALGK